MEQTMLSLASKEGLFAVMFIALFFYTIMDSRNREKRLMDFIDAITQKFETLARQYERLAEDVDAIRNDMKDICKK